MEKQDKKEMICGALDFIFWAIVVIGSFFLIGFIVRDLYSVPAILTDTTTQEIYLPEKYEIVEGVTNAFEHYREGTFSLAGAGGVGLPQINRSLEAYKANESGNTHYIDITTIYQLETVFSPALVTVDVYDVGVDRVFHAVITTVGGPEWRSRWNLFSGSYTEASSVVIKDGKLIVQWVAKTRNIFEWTVAFFCMICFILPWMVVVRLAARLIRFLLLRR